MPDGRVATYETFKVCESFETRDSYGLTVGQVLIWTLCGLSTIFLVTRLLIRLSSKEPLKKSDYLLLLALPSLFCGSALLWSTLDALYDLSDTGSKADQSRARGATATSRLTASIELLWIAIYCVKASFLLQFKFHKPPFSLVSANLTRHYWATSGTCIASFLCTLAVPPILCSSSRRRQLRCLTTTLLIMVRLPLLRSIFCKCAGFGDLHDHYRYRHRSSKYATLGSKLNHGTDKVWQSYRYRLCSFGWQTSRYCVLL